MRATLILLTLAALALWLWRGSPTVDPADEARLAAAPRYQLQGLESLRTDEQGKPLLRLTAAKGAYFDNGAATLDEIHVAGLSGSAAPWRLAAPLGSVPAGEKRLLLHAPVTGQGRWADGEPFDFRGEEVWVEDRERRLHSKRPMTLSSASRSAKAKGFTASFDGKTLQMIAPDLSYDLGS
jgi:LPS export ABC transporter protein LptC